MSDPNPPPHPPTIPYAHVMPPDPPPRGRFAKQYFIALGAGVVLSVIAWSTSFKSQNQSAVGFLMIAIPLVKFVAGVTFLCLRGFRGYGAGLLTSLTLGFLIFFGYCAANLKL